MFVSVHSRIIIFRILVWYNHGNLIEILVKSFHKWIASQWISISLLWCRGPFWQLVVGLKEKKTSLMITTMTTRLHKQKIVKNVEANASILTITNFDRECDWERFCGKRKIRHEFYSSIQSSIKLMKLSKCVCLFWIFKSSGFWRWIKLNMLFLHGTR